MVTRRGAGSLLFFFAAVAVRALPITDDNKNDLANQSEEEKRGNVMFKSKSDWSTDYGWPKDSSLEGNRLDYLPANRDTSPWKSNLRTDLMYLPYLQKRQKQRHRYDPELKFIGLGKRQRQRPKYDPGWKFIGLGKRDGGDIPTAKRDNSGIYQNPYLGILALANLTDFFSNLKTELRSDRGRASSINNMEGVEGKSYDLPNENSVVYVRDRKPSGSKPRHVYDPGWRLTGLGKRVQ